MDKSTERFLQLLEKQNVAIAALAAQEAEKESQRRLQVDPIRIQREKERREKWGQLRAREQPSRRPTRARRVFPHVDIS